MADFYVDHGNTTLYTTAYMATPTWNQPQEGDGTASGTGTTPACALGSIAFTGTATGRNAGTVSICGVTVTPSYSDTNSTQATNLANAINVGTGGANGTGALLTVVFPSKSGSITSVRLNALVYARVVGDTCEVMTRIATDAFNGQTISVASWNGGGTVTPTNWSGGVSGPWRYFINESALGATIGSGGTGSNAQFGYGAWMGTTMGNPGASDWVYVRTRRGGSNISALCTTASNTVLYPTSVSRPVRFVADDGTIWSTDDGVFTLGCASSHGAATTSVALYNGQVHGRNGRFRVLFQSGTSAGWNGGIIGWMNAQTSTAMWDGVLFEIDSGSGSTTNSKFIITGHANGNWHQTFRRCTFRNSKSNQPNFPWCNPAGGASGPARVVFEDCAFEVTGLTANPSSRMFGITLNAYAAELIAKGCVIRDLNDANIRFPVLGITTSSNSEAPVHAIIEDIAGASTAAGDLSVGFTNAYDPTGTPGGFNVNNKHMLLTTKDRSVYRHETMLGITDWNAADGYPTRSATLPDGTAWSLRTLWNGQYISPLAPHCVDLSQWYTGSAATKTIEVEMLFDNAITGSDITKERIALVVTYLGNDSVVYTETTLPELPAGSTALATGAAWTTSGGYTTWLARKLSLTTANSVKPNSEISAKVCFISPCPAAAAGKYCFIDPEFTIS